MVMGSGMVGWMQGGHWISPVSGLMRQAVSQRGSRSTCCENEFLGQKEMMAMDKDATKIIWDNIFTFMIYPLLYNLINAEIPL